MLRSQAVGLQECMENKCLRCGPRADGQNEVAAKMGGRFYIRPPPPTSPPTSPPPICLYICQPPPLPPTSPSTSCPHPHVLQHSGQLRPAAKPAHKSHPYPHTIFHAAAQTNSHLLQHSHGLAQLRRLPRPHHPIGDVTHGPQTLRNRGQGTPRMTPAGEGGGKPVGGNEGRGTYFIHVPGANLKRSQPPPRAMP